MTASKLEGFTFIPKGKPRPLLIPRGIFASYLIAPEAETSSCYKVLHPRANNIVLDLFRVTLASESDAINIYKIKCILHQRVKW